RGAAPQAEVGRWRELLALNAAAPQLSQARRAGHHRHREQLAHCRGGHVVTTVTAAPLGTAAQTSTRPVRLVLGAIGTCLVAWLMGNTFLALSYYPGWFFDSRVLMAVVGIIAGLGGAALLFYCVNVFVEALPQRFSQGLIPYAYVLPALALIALMLVYPTVQTINYSFANDDSTAYVGLDAYRAIFTDGE